MNNLSNLLDKFKNIIGNSKFQKDAVISVIRKIANITLEEKHFEIKDFIIHLNASPFVRSELYMRKQKILAELKASLGSKAPKDIR